MTLSGSRGALVTSASVVSTSDVIARVIWSAILGLLTAGVPAMEASDSPPTMACAPANKGDVVPMTCVSCCVLPAEAVGLRAPVHLRVALDHAVVAPMAGIDPKAASPPPRSVRI